MFAQLLYISAAVASYGGLWPIPKTHDAVSACGPVCGGVNNECDLVCDKDKIVQLDGVTSGTMLVTCPATADAPTVQSQLSKLSSLIPFGLDFDVTLANCTTFVPGRLMKEKYTLSYDGTAKKMTIVADEVFGAIRALSTVAGMVSAVDTDSLTRVLGGLDLSRVEQERFHRGESNIFAWNDFTITNDEPAYIHRGIMLDTGRFHLSPVTIKTHLDYMYMSKMNVLHWHATDDQYFPFMLNSSLALDDGALMVGSVKLDEFLQGSACDLSVGKYCANVMPGVESTDYFTRTRIAEIVQYAWERGIRVVFEIDSPAHARSWGAGERASKWDDNSWTGTDRVGDKTSTLTNMCWGATSQLGSVCLQQPCGPVNLNRAADGSWVNGNPEKIFKAVVDGFKMVETTFAAPFDGEALVPAGESFHVGLDEVLQGCLDPLSDEADPYDPSTHNPAVKTLAAMSKWIEFLVDTVTTAGFAPTAWADIMAHGKYEGDTLDALKKVVPQVWGTVPDDIINITTVHPKNIVWSPFETAYLDCGLGNNAVTGFGSWCRPWKNFWHLYTINPRAMPNFKDDAAVTFDGAETPLWSEIVTNSNSVARMWPRAAALGGALWTPRASVDNLTMGEVNVLTTYDFKSLTTPDMLAEKAWIEWTERQANVDSLMPEKTNFCVKNPLESWACRTYSQDIYKFEEGRPVAPPPPTECSGNPVIAAGLAALALFLW